MKGVVMASKVSYTEFTQVMTDAEKRRFKRRLEVANMAENGASYHQIYDALGVSQAVVDNTRRIIGLKA